MSLYSSRIKVCISHSHTVYTTETRSSWWHIQENGRWYPTILAIEKWNIRSMFLFSIFSPPGGVEGLRKYVKSILSKFSQCIYLGRKVALCVCTMTRYSCAKLPIIWSLWIRVSTQEYAINWRLIVLAFWRSSTLIERETFALLFLSATKISLEISHIVRRKFHSIRLLGSTIFSANVWKYAKYNFRDSRQYILEPPSTYFLVVASRCVLDSTFCMFAKSSVCQRCLNLQGRSRFYICAPAMFTGGALIKLQVSHYQIAKWSRCKLNLRVRK